MAIYTISIDVYYRPFCFNWEYMEFQRKTLVNEISILFLRYVNMKNRNLFLAIVLVAIVFFTSCMDDDSFTTSPSAVLTFETDTVRMDTTFQMYQLLHVPFGYTIILMLVYVWLLCDWKMVQVQDIVLM